MAVPKGVRVAGRAKGTPNKATTERRLQAERERAEAKASGKKLAKERIDEFMELFIGIARHYQPVLPAMLARGVEPNPNASWPDFEKWSMHAIEAAEALAKYQSPQFRAVAVVATEERRPNAYSTDARERLRRLIVTVINADPKDEPLDPVRALIAPINGKAN
jgi:hypothetical protein